MSKVVKYATILLSVVGARDFERKTKFRLVVYSESLGGDMSFNGAVARFLAEFNFEQDKEIEVRLYFDGQRLMRGNGWSTYCGVVEMPAYYVHNLGSEFDNLDESDWKEIIEEMIEVFHADKHSDMELFGVWAHSRTGENNERRWECGPIKSRRYNSYVNVGRVDAYDQAFAEVITRQLAKNKSLGAGTKDST